MALEMFRGPADETRHLLQRCGITNTSDTADIGSSDKDVGLEPKCEADSLPRTQLLFTELVVDSDEDD